MRSVMTFRAKANLPLKIETSTRFSFYCKKR